MNKTSIAMALAAPLAFSSAYAQDSFAFPAVTISGFGTLAVTRTDTDSAQFARPNQAAGASKSFRTGVDSNLGLQGSANLNSWLSATAQGLVRKDGEDDFGAELSWAFLKGKVNDNFSVRVGRMGLPVFMISDYRNVGFANFMLRPPAEVYAQVPINNIDGIDTTWQQSFGDTTVSAQLAIGRAKNDISSSARPLHLETTNLVALNLVAEHGPVNIRFGRADGKLTLNDSPSLNTLLSGLRAAGTGYRLSALGTLADNLALDHKKASFTSAGATMDWNNIVVQTEYAKRKTDSYVNDTDSWYFMAGYRFGHVLPYFNHAETKSVGRVSNSVPTACPAGYPAACTPTIRALSAGVDVLSTPVRQSTDTIGVRWDFHSSLALKAQVDRVRPSGNAGLLLRPTPGVTGPVTVGAVALDFVF